MEKFTEILQNKPFWSTFVILGISVIIGIFFSKFDVLLVVLGFATLVLYILSFILPPTGVIDSSVIKAIDSLKHYMLMITALEVLLHGGHLDINYESFHLFVGL